MAKKRKTIIITLGVLLLLGGAYAATTTHIRNTNRAFFDNLAPSPTLGDLNSSDIVRIEVSGMVLQKQHDKWELTSYNGEAPPEGIELDQTMIRSMTLVLATVWAERIADEKPEDLSVFGLDMPSRTIVTDSHGNTVVYLVGSITPFRTSYFVMAEGNPNVFVVNAFSVERVRFSLDDIRNRALFPPLPLHDLTRMRLELAETHIDIRPLPEQRPLHLISTFSHFLMTSPYQVPQGVDSTALQRLLAPLFNRRIEAFVNDAPLSLTPYGLDNPARLLLEFGDTSLDLLIGNRSGMARYAKLAGAPGVFTVEGLEQLINIRPFILTDRLPLFIGIDEISRFSISGGERTLHAEIHGTGRDAVFFLNGRRAEEMSFRNWFQNVILLSADAEMPAGSVISPYSPETISIEHHLKNGERVSISLVPYNRDFYALNQEGVMEFLIARNQVRRIVQAADTVVFLQKP